jgi:hypothetical protein
VARLKGVRRQGEWRGGGGHVGMVGPAVASASPPRVARHSGLRRQGEWRGTLGLGGAPARALTPPPPHSPSLTSPSLIPGGVGGGCSSSSPSLILQQEG